MKNKKIIFPRNFLWGVATAAHQTEGGNHNDWSEWEEDNAQRLATEAEKKHSLWHRKKFPEMLKAKNYISGKACDSYNFYEKDIEIIEKINCNSYRFSIEWSRIEPTEGVFDKRELEHYRKILELLKEKEIKPFVTLWHYTNPIWIRDLGGVKSKKFPFYFSRYAKFVVENLGDLADFWITFNEPTVVAFNGYVTGNWLPQKKNVFLAMSALKNFARAHNLAYDEIHSVSKNAKVGFANNVWSIEPFRKNSFFDKLIAKVSKHFVNNEILNLTEGKNDFLAVQYYFHRFARFPYGLRNGNGVFSDMGAEIVPRGIYFVLKDMQRYNLPIYITENGLADQDDSRRANFIKTHLQWTRRAIDEGVDVRGYFHWSLLDNFEWDKGFWPRFGLVEVDPETMKRKMRSSAMTYADICKNNGFDIENHF